MKKALAYYRVSTEEQAKEGVSLEAQQRFCRRWAKQNGYKVEKEYFDKGKSATNLNRPALQEMLSSIGNTKVNAVIVFDTDRLARNTLDHLTIKSVLKQNDVQLISVNQPMIDDSPEGKMIDTMLASVSAFQSDITARKTRKTLEEKANLGWYPALPPLGYINTVNPNPTCTLDKKIVVPDKSISKSITKAFSMYATGNYSVPQIVDYLSDKGVISKQGGKPHKNTVRRMLSNKFYTGSFIWGKKEYRGNHQKLVEKSIFIKCQRVLKTFDIRRRSHNFLLNGFLYTNEGIRLFGEKKIKNSGKVFEYYRYKDKQGYKHYKSKELEEQVQNIFNTITISKEYTQYVLDVARKLLKEHRKTQTTERKKLNKTKLKLEKAIKELEDARFLHNTIDNAKFTEIYTRYEDEISDINQKLSETDKDYSKNIKKLKELLFLAENIGVAYKNADKLQKRAYQNLFFEKFIVGPEKIENYTLKNEVKGLVEQGSVRISTIWGDIVNQVRTEISECKLEIFIPTMKRQLTT